MIVTSDGNIPSLFAHSFNVMKMAQGFTDAGKNVELVSLMSIPNLIECVRVKNIRRHYGVSKKVKIKFLPIYNRDFFSKRVGAAGFNKAVASYAKRQNTDLIFCRSYLSALYSVREEIPTIMESHTTNYDNPHLREIYKISNNRMFLGLVTIHDQIRLEHMKRGIPSEKILVLDDGVDFSLFEEAQNTEVLRRKLSLPIDKKIILYSGSLHKEKGIGQILEVAGRFRTNDQFLFVIVGGSSDQVSYWKAACAKMEIGNVVFRGFQANVLVPQYLQSADLLFMPYDTRVDYKVMDIHSTSPLKLFEYMASRTPILATDIPVVRKIISEDHAYLATPNDMDEISSLIYRALGNREEASRKAQNAFNQAKAFQWKTRCKRILDYYL